MMRKIAAAGTLMTAIWTATLLAQCPKGADNCVTVVKPTNGIGPGTETNTTYDNNAHTEAVSNAASALTAAGLTYLLVVRPAIQAGHNAKINRAEGQFAPVYEMLNAVIAKSVPETVSPVFAIPLSSIKGLYLGETWQQFVSSSPYLQKRIASCATEKRPDPKKKIRRREFNPCSTAWLMTDSPNARLTLDCVAWGLGAGSDMICQDFSGEVSFQVGKLVSLKVVIAEDWSTVYPDIISKFGQPNGRNENNTLALWSTKEFHVAATEIDQGTAIAWVTQSRYREIAKAQQSLVTIEKQQNSLD